MSDLSHSIFTSKAASHVVLGTIRLLAGAALLAGAVTKLQQPFEFLNDVYRYQLPGAGLNLLIGMCLPWIEIVTALCLLGEIFLDGALLCVVLLGGLFTVAVGSALYRGLQISCGCFVTHDDLRISYWTLVRSLLVLTAGLVGIVYQQISFPRPQRNRGADH